MNTVKYCGKGSLISISGRLQSRSYEKDGNRVYVTEVVSEELRFLSTKPPAKQQDPVHQHQADGTGNGDSTAVAAAEDWHDERREAPPALTGNHRSSAVFESRHGSRHVNQAGDISGKSREEPDSDSQNVLNRDTEGLPITP